MKTITGKQLKQLLTLPASEKLRIANVLLSNVVEAADQEEPIELTEEIKAELDRRMAEYDRDPSTLLNQEEFNRELDRRLARRKLRRA